MLERYGLELTTDDIARSWLELLPFSQTFWSPGFGMLTDRFGVEWMVNTPQPR